MAILIKGVEMPKDCMFCPMAHWNKIDRLTGCEVVGGKRYVPEMDTVYWESGHRPDWCPLVEVPKHGRLIDADEFEKYVELEYETREISHPNWIKFRVWCGDQPTIIEAEG